MSHIKDDRGRSVSQLDPVTLHVWHRYDSVDAEVLEEIVESLEPGTAKARRLMIFLVPITLVVIATFVAVLYYYFDTSARRDLVSTITNPVIMVPNVLCCFFVPWIIARHARTNRMRFAMLKHRRCPHCGYDLRNLPAAPDDGATVCPECGCAWLIDEASLAEALATAMPVPPTGVQRKILVVVGLLLAATALAGLFFARLMG